MRHPNAGGEAYYDLFDDWPLIEASFLKQYGIRLRADDDMSWNEFCNLLAGIMYDTPLGRVAAIRSETDPKKIAEYTPEEARIYYEWLGEHGNGLNALTNMQNQLMALCN